MSDSAAHLPPAGTNANAGIDKQTYVAITFAAVSDSIVPSIMTDERHLHTASARTSPMCNTIHVTALGTGLLEEKDKANEAIQLFCAASKKTLPSKQLL